MESLRRSAILLLSAFAVSMGGCETAPVYLPMPNPHPNGDGGPSEPDAAPATDASMPRYRLDAGSAAPADAGVTPPGPRRCGSAVAARIAVRSVDPGATDDGIRAGDPPHSYVPAVGSANGRLFVLLPDVGARPEDYGDILRNAAAGGYDAIGLSYINDVRTLELCSRATDDRCQEDVRLETIFGEDHGARVDVSPADSIISRLVALLIYLGWEDYVAAGEPVWSAIVIAGHSEGAGHAALIAGLERADRVILFSGPEPAPWTLAPRATPAEREFAFAHVDDPLFRTFPRSWTNLAIPGPPTNIDARSLPYGDSHQLVTSVPPADGNAHDAPVVDTATPRDADGLPVYRDAWCLVLGL